VKTVPKPLPVKVSQRIGRRGAGVSLAPGRTKGSSPVPARDHPVPGALKLKRVLVPLDFSVPSTKALQYALSLAERFNATLCLLHVFEPPSFVNDLNNTPLVVSDATVVNRLHHKLVMLARQEIDPLIHVVPQVRVGKPFHEIVTAAKQMNADLIVIATHGYTGFKHVMLGSTAERVVRHAPCPVLVVREREHEFVQTEGITHENGR
jgi:nucleotide-binding universal stress UspA family protein